MGRFDWVFYGNSSISIAVILSQKAPNCFLGSLDGPALSLLQRLTSA